MYRKGHPHLVVLSYFDTLLRIFLRTAVLSFPLRARIIALPPKLFLVVLATSKAFSSPHETFEIVQTRCPFSFLWIFASSSLTDPSAIRMDECVEYVAGAEIEDGGLFVHQSEHASFQIATPTVTIRMNHGRPHQLAKVDPTGQFDLLHNLTWQMNIAVHHTEVSRCCQAIRPLQGFELPSTSPKGVYLGLPMSCIPIRFENNAFSFGGGTFIVY